MSGGPAGVVEAPGTLDPAVAEGFARQREHASALPRDPAQRRAAGAAAATALADRLRRENPGYARLWSERGPFPALDKAFLARHFDAFADGLPVTSLGAERFAAEAFRLGSRFDERHLVFTSSGSTGRPLPVVYGLRDFGRSIAAFADRAVLADRPDARSLLYVGLLDRHNGGNAWMWYLGGALHTVLADVFASPADLHDVVQRLRPDVILTRPHQLLAIGAAAAARGAALPAAHLLSVGEALQPEQRAGIAAYWGRPPHNSYSTVETGPLGYQDEPDRDELALYGELSHVELLDAAGEPVAVPGVPGRVVATTLYREVLPLVRYRIGDVAAWADEACTRLTFPLGRDTQVLTLRTARGSARMPELALWSLRAPGLRQYQIVQRAPDRLLVRCETVEGTRWPQLADEVREWVSVLVRRETGLRVEVACERVTALRPDRGSGKIKRIVPLPDGPAPA